MSDSTKEQVFVLSPFLRELEGHSAVKKDASLCEKVEEAVKALGVGDVEPTIDLIIGMLKVKNTEAVSLCIKCLTEMFLSKNFEFFLSSGNALALLHALVRILQVVKPKTSLFSEVAQCLTLFLISPNQQLYVHGKELTFALQSLLELFEKKTQPAEKKVIETVLKRVMHNIESLAMKAVDEYVAGDYRNMITFLVGALAGDLKPDTAVLVIGLIETTVFEAPEDLRKTEAHKQVLLVEIPQLFIQSALTVSNEVFERLFVLYKRFVELGDLVVTSFSMIIGEMITPAIDSGSESALRAISMLRVFDQKRPDLLLVFALCDCSSYTAKRVFEELFQAISKFLMDNVANVQIAGPCLEMLFATLFAYRKFYVKFAEDKLVDAKTEREVIEQKMTTEGCAKVFNESPKKGIAAILKSGLAEDTPESLAKFLRGCSLLDPVKLSEYLAGGSANDVLAAFVNMYEFKDLTLDAALRELCASYRLPGESQQIDRVMQCFAAKYHKDNPDTMSEDAAYVISFSIIMLHTDIYNPNVAKKITCDQWITNTRHVKEACEVEIDVLKGIYDRVVAKPMKLNEGTLSPTAEAAELKNRSRKQLKKLMERSQGHELPQVTPELYMLAIERLWSTLFAAFSLTVQGSTEFSIIAKALNCIKLLVFFLSTFSMAKELETVITFMCSICSMPGIEVAGLKALVAVVKLNGNGLGESWYPVLDLFSKVVRPFLPANRYQPLDENATTTMLPRIEGAPITDIESIYLDSATLDREPFFYFARFLCQISTAEIFENPPSLFTLQQIIEVCLANTSRVRFVWSHAWSIFSEHYCRIACLLHEQISMAAIEGLVKVAINLSGIQEKWQHFQSDILAPFLVIFQNQPMVAQKKLVVARLSKWLDGSVLLDSGWDVLLDVFQLGANDESRQIVATTYKTLETNLAYVPERFNTKLVGVLLAYARQTKVSAINGTAMAYVTSVSMKICPVQPSLVTSISNVLLTTNNKEVMSFATNLIFMLVAKLSLDWEQKESEFVLPLLTTSNPELLTIIVNEIFKTLIPECHPNALCLVPKVAEMLLEMGNQAVLKLFTERVVALDAPGSNVPVETLTRIVNHKACTPALLLVVTDELRATDESFVVLDICVQKGIEHSNVKTVLDGFRKMMTLMSDKYAERLAAVLISVVKFANTVEPEPSNAILSFVKEVLDRDIEFVKPVRKEFQQSLFDFYLNKSMAVRNVARDLALRSRVLFE